MIKNSKKSILLILLIVFLVTGCSVYSINSLSYDKITDLILYDKSPNPNTALGGFKFYLPRDMRIKKQLDNNVIIYSNRNKLYLYVDIIGYHNKQNNDYNLELNGSRIYAKEFEHQDKKGYLIVTEQDNDYFLEVMFNYAKIETIVDKANLKNSISKSLIILSSIFYNEKVIDSLVGEDTLNYNEETYNLISPNNAISNFLDVADDEYDDVDNELPDEDIIDALDKEQ